jgi:solute carrier family 25 iron transporter 28/37
MNIPYGCIMVATNESVKKMLNPSNEYNFTASLISGCIAGGTAAMLTTPLDVVKTRLQTQGYVIDNSIIHSTTTQSVDTINMSHCPEYNKGVTKHINNGMKTPLYSVPSMANSTANSFMSSQHRPQLRYYSVTQTIRLIVEEEGINAFIRGVVPRVLTHAPSVAISWTAYEMAKSLLSHLKE